VSVSCALYFSSVGALSKAIVDELFRPMRRSKRSQSG
jgi:hypothetical protein